VRERIVALFPVVVPDAGRSHSPAGHRFDEQENVSLIHSTPAERKRLQHSVDRPLVAAKDVTGERFWQWPGNVRELENIMERSVIRSTGPILDVALVELGGTDTPGTRQ
jgi:DNA-binding NtrC family response regulator